MAAAMELRSRGLLDRFGIAYHDTPSHHPGTYVN